MYFKLYKDTAGYWRWTFYAVNGRKLADRAKELRPSLKILFMTGYSRNAIIHQGRLDAGVDLIQKPITSEELSTTLRKILDPSR